jgi:hypothetical protein
MKKALLFSFALMLVAGMAFAQSGGSVGIFADNAGASCNLTDTPGGTLKQYYVCHVVHAGMTGSQFRAKMPTCMTGATYLSDTNVFPVVIGNTQSGYAAGYGACKPAPVHVVTINVFVMGMTPACCYWVVDGDPAVPSGQIEVSDCGFNTLIATGGAGIINANSSCDCDVPSDATTWGQVKALFE